MPKHDELIPATRDTAAVNVNRLAENEFDATADPLRFLAVGMSAAAHLERIATLHTMMRRRREVLRQMENDKRGN